MNFKESWEGVLFFCLEVICVDWPFGDGAACPSVPNSLRVQGTVAVISLLLVQLVYPQLVDGLAICILWLVCSLQQLQQNDGVAFGEEAAPPQLREQ